MAVSFESSERSKRKARTRSTVHASGSRHGDEFWAEEKQRNNFGLKYMNKLGWSKGDGLGRNRQGDPKCLKTKYKNDNKGVGCTQVQNDSMFQATMCMFNDILSGLNNQKKKDKDKSSKANNVTNKANMTASDIIRSYEAKHHLYGRFRAAKNISNRSEEEKAEIFGGVGSVNANGFTEKDQTNYALRMNALAEQRSGKMGLGFHRNDNDDSFDRSTLMFGKFTSSGHITREDLFAPSDDDQNEDAKEQPNEPSNTEQETKSEKQKKSKKKKKKKKKDKMQTEEVKKELIECESIEIPKPEDMQQGDDGLPVTQKKKEKKKDKSKKKKKKDKKRKEEEMNIAVHDTLQISSGAVVNVTEEDSKSKKKDKKKKKSKKRKLENEENQNEMQQPAAKKLKLDPQQLEISKDDLSDSSSVSSSASILSSVATPRQSEMELSMETKKKKKKKTKTKKDKSKKKDKSGKKKSKKTLTE